MALVVAVPALAQAPRITPRGDPSVRSDTIYSLAVRPEDHPDEPYVVLLDDGVVRLEADGTGSRTYRMVVQILQQDAVEDWAERSFSYSPGHERLTVNWIRVVRPNGEVVSDKPRMSQDADIPAHLRDPVYGDRKVRRVSLSGVEPGTIVDFSYTTEELKPFLPGDFFSTWSVHTGQLTRRSRYVLDIPASMTPRIKERNLDFARVERVAGTRRVYTWATKDVEKVKPEPFAADSNGVYMSIAVSAPMEWQRLATWYSGLAKDRYTLTPALEKKLADLVSGARSWDDSLRAVHRWVAQDIRYVSIALGMGGYQPRAPAAVLETQYGDCKDKATIFVAMVQRMGRRSYPVLLNSTGGVDRGMPSIEQFDHAIAAVEKPGGGYLFVDLTSELTPLGSLPFSEQGEFAIVVHPDGRGEEVTLPKDPPATNLAETVIVGELLANGRVNARYVERALGARQYSLRGLFTSPLDSTKRALLTRALAQNVFTGASGDSLRIFDGKDLSAEPRVEILVRQGQAAKAAGKSAILTLPFPNMSGFANSAADLESRGERRFPIDVASVLGPVAGVSELRLTLPTGWRAQLPSNVNVSGVYGSYSVEYSQTGRELRVVKRITGADGVQPPEAVSGLIKWMKEMAADDVEYIVLEQ
jgi:transglutaminase-like putative cysteine protease